MSELDRAIDAQVATLNRRRQWLRNRKLVLRRDARNFCSKPATLVGAFLAGAVLGTLNVPRAGPKKAGSRAAAASSVLRHQAATSLQLLVLNTVVDFFSKRWGSARDRMARNNESPGA